MDARHLGFTVFLIFLGVTAAMLPVLHYLRMGWEAKRRDIMAGFNRRARVAYHGRFCRDDPSSTDDEIYRKFESMYTDRYGRRFYVIPALMLFLTMTTVTTLMVVTVLHTQGFLSVNPFIDLKHPTLAALAGAYLWVVDDFLTRARRMDFHPSDINWGVLRLLVAVPMGYAFAALVKDGFAEFVAFALGAFPITTLLALLRRIFNEKLGLGPTEEAAADDIVKLQGVNRDIVERLAKEDITTIPQFAYCDPVQLAMRSSLTFDFVTDCMNQALAWMYLKDGQVTLSPLGLRGAAEIRHFVADLDNVAATDPEAQAAHQRAIDAFPKYADSLKQTPETLQVVLREIAGDPYTIFLDEVWN